MPNASQDNWIAKKVNVREGNLEEFLIESKILKNRRKIWIYTPNHFNIDETYGYMLVFDGWEYINIVPTPTILDNLIGVKKIKPMIAIFIDNIDFETRVNEYPCNDAFVEFLIKELLPFVKSKYKLSDKPIENVIAGSSGGGIASAYFILRHQNYFGNALIQSGAFMWDITDPNKHNYLLNEYEALSNLDIRFYVLVIRI